MLAQRWCTIPAPLLSIRDETEALITGFLDFGTQIPSSPTSSFRRDIWNGHQLSGPSAVDTAFNIVLVFSGKLTGSGQWLGSGIGILESLALQVMFPNIPELAGWSNVGTGTPISLPDLPTDSKHEMSVRFTLPAGAQEVPVDIKIGIEFQRTQALPGGIYTHRPGILRGVNRGVGTAVLSRDAAITVFGTGATSAIRWPTYAWHTDVKPFQELGGNPLGDDPLTNLDKSASALIAGEAYGFRTVLTATGRLISKSDKVTGTPVFPTDFDVAPEGSIATGWGIRFADADALAPQHTELVDATPKFFDVVTSGLNYTVAPVGIAAIAHGRLNTNKTENAGTFPGDGTHTVWVLPDGSVDDTADGSTPQVGSLRIVEIVIAASVETSRIDHRPWELGLPIIYTFIGASNNDSAGIPNLSTSTLFIRPDKVALFIPVLPSGFTPTPTSGRVEIEIEIEVSDGTLTSIFTSGVLPGYDWDATSRVAIGLPEVLEIPPISALVFTVKNTLAPGSAPDWLDVLVGADIA